MLREIHISAFHRVVVDVFNFLAHHRLAVDHFRVRAFLPQLIHPVLLMRAFAEAQTLQGFVGAFCLQVIDDLSRGEGLELAEAFAQIGCLGDEVQVVFQNHVAV